VVDEEQAPTPFDQFPGGWEEDRPAGTVVRDRDRDATLRGHDLKIDVGTGVLHAIGGQLGRQQQCLVNERREVRLDKRRPDECASRRRRTAVGRQPDPADHAG